MKKLTFLIATALACFSVAPAGATTTITDVAVNVGFPKAGDATATASATVTLPADANYEITGSQFYSADGNSISETKFQPNTTYLFRFYVQPNDGYVFPVQSGTTKPDITAMTLSINGKEPDKTQSWSNYKIGLFVYFTTGDADFLATPTFSNNSSWFIDSTNITMACGTEGATIYYTTDGTEPSATKGTKYTDEFTLYATGDDVTLKAIAVKGDKASEVASNTYKTYFSVLISAKDGSDGSKTVTLATEVPAAATAEIRYTTDGTTTSESSTLYTTPFTITETTTIKARVYGVKNVRTLDNELKIKFPDTIKSVSVDVVFPVFGDEVNDSTAKVTLPDDANYEVVDLQFYDNVEGNLFTGQFSPNTTYQCVVSVQPKEGYVFPTANAETTQPDATAMTLSINGEKPKQTMCWLDYKIRLLTLFTTEDLPDTITNVSVNVICPEAGDTVAAESATVTLPADANYEITGSKFYYADGNSISETKFNPNTTYLYQVFIQPKEGYVFPTASAESTYPNLGAMTLSINDETPYKVYGWQNYKIGLTIKFTTGDADFLSTPIVSYSRAWFSDSTNMTMTCGTASATIYYTTDGTEPSAESGTLYTDEFTLYATGDDVTLKAIAVKGEEASEVVSYTYKTYLSVLISAENGSEGSKVTLATKVPVASPVEIRYTTDGTTTSESSTLYTAPFTITETTTIKARVYGVKNIQTLDNESVIDTSTAINTVTCDELRTDNGRIHGADDIRIYDLLGRDVTRLNGSLCGVYVVKTANSAQKVVVK
ncbi:MAG: chitobiase/beta-hexosaminidase C-terminal domain-containing protein [Bacteroidales bacterium]|nr:chitobiase/beta-hexosaminidase C-terminal domain-containing protein [Bacteroidales bacterium]MDY6036412.1 chitobiase/beta-hexosaminidase C-terminal domain-containing protein [Paludibacteraceae bacterium]